MLLLLLLSGLLLSLQHKSSITSESLVLVWDDHYWQTRRLLTAHVKGWQRRNKTCCSFRRHSHGLASTAGSAEDDHLKGRLECHHYLGLQIGGFSRYVSFPYVYLSISHFSKIFLTKRLKSTTQSQLSSWTMQPGVVEKALAIWPCVVLFVEPSISSCLGRLTEFWRNFWVGSPLFNKGWPLPDIFVTFQESLKWDTIDNPQDSHGTNGIFIYIYHIKATIHVGKYTIVPWILWDIVSA